MRPAILNSQKDIERTVKVHQYKLPVSFKELVVSARRYIIFPSEGTYTLPTGLSKRLTPSRWIATPLTHIIWINSSSVRYSITTNKSNACMFSIFTIPSSRRGNFPYFSSQIIDKSYFLFLPPATLGSITWSEFQRVAQQDFGYS